MKAQLISFLLFTTIFVTGCSNSSNLENQDTDSESSSLIFTGSDIGDKVMKNLSKTDRDEYSLRMKFKNNDKVLTIYSIEGYRVYQNFPGYYIDILRSLKKSDLSDFSQIKIDTNLFNATFDVNTIKSLPLSDKEIKNLGYEEDGDADYDEFINRYLKIRTVAYKDKDTDE
ncbi:hypothetical protein PSQ53_10375 [Limosilactobacillus reuteri]|uniref:Lipoprotein n=1 Tax=Limosilactobacillus reuteri TaxID=1598 RepID=A0AAW6JKT0_LIMRT|nr:hypothetical protein [Limosilactobacillus reuteri]MDD1383309.1 hypothetical protein [Limosilactobacillus reuteri]MDD1399094.1 hypothetical protein [Limosilactobacillus reuteri]MDD1404748.1 hypothetical protein [Limosilactobacillus reuteri]